jgi:phosphoglycolate phosphatase
VAECCPALGEALDALATRPDVVQTVLTGNLRAVSIIKLRVYGLDRHIDVASGAYGDDDRHRPNLVRVAQARARQRHGIEFAAANTVIIGDSRQDVATAQEAGAAIMAVASGRDSLDELRAAGAMTAVPDLRDTDATIQAILSS